MLLALPTADAGAATIAVKQDGAAAAVPAAGLVARDPNPDVVLGFGSGEASYSLAVNGPGGEAAGVACTDAGGSDTRRVSYTGNGEYVVVLRTYPLVNCTGAARERRETFTIAARDVVVAPPGGVLLLREPYSYSYLDHRLGLDLAPGATSHEIVYARDARLGADGAIVGEAEPAFVVEDKAELILSRPGSYTVLARPAGVGLNGATLAAPWGPPLRLRVLAPFDLERTEYLDSRGPTYDMRLFVRERSAAGRVRVTAARGARGKRFRSLGAATMRRGVLRKRFTLTRRGAYRLRFSFAGSDTIAAGTITFAITIR